MHNGVARGVHVGSFAPNPCTYAPILCMTLCSFVEPITVCIVFHYTITASDVICHDIYVVYDIYGRS